ncbi:MAG: hypothetical protein ABI333_26525 [bacterium]
MASDQQPEFLRALNTEIRTEDPGAFNLRMESLVRQAGEQHLAWGVGRAELKLLVRHHCRRFERKTASGAFTEGAYFPLFRWFYDTDRVGREHVVEVLERLFELSEGLDDPVSSAAATSSRVIRTWTRLMRPGTPLESTPASQLMLWRVLESLVKGELEVAAQSWGELPLHYPRFASPDRLLVRSSDERRAEILSNLRFTLGCASLRRPSLSRLLEQHEGLSYESRRELIHAVTTRKPTQAEPISALLRHHIELLALAAYDALGAFDALIQEFVTYLRTEVLTQVESPGNALLLDYLPVLQERYLPALWNYCRIFREAARGCPFLGDLLQEAYLVRTVGFDGDQEPSFPRLLRDWSGVQRVIEARAGYRGSGGFTFMGAYLRDALPDGAERVASSRGRTRRGFAAKALGDFETYLELEAHAPAGEGSTDATGAETDDGEAFLTATTQILPILSDDDLELHSSVTEKLPVTEDGFVDLKRVATQILPTMPGFDDIEE